MIQPGYYQTINTRIPLIDRSQNIMYHGIVKILRHDRNMGIFRKGYIIKFPFFPFNPNLIRIFKHDRCAMSGKQLIKTHSTSSNTSFARKT